MFQMQSMMYAAWPWAVESFSADLNVNMLKDNTILALLFLSTE
jgi:hypothetical protein